MAKKIKKPVIKPQDDGTGDPILPPKGTVPPIPPTP